MFNLHFTPSSTWTWAAMSSCTSTSPSSSRTHVASSLLCCSCPQAVQVTGPLPCSCCPTEQLLPGESAHPLLPARKEPRLDPLDGHLFRMAPRGWDMPSRAVCPLSGAGSTTPAPASITQCGKMGVPCPRCHPCWGLRTPVGSAPRPPCLAPHRAMGMRPPGQHVLTSSAWGPPWGGQGGGPGCADAARGEQSSCVYFPSAEGNNRGIFLI